MGRRRAAEQPPLTLNLYSAPASLTRASHKQGSATGQRSQYRSHVLAGPGVVKRAGSAWRQAAAARHSS